MSRLTGEVREAAKKSRPTGEVREAAQKSRLTGEVREAAKTSRPTGEVREAAPKSRLNGEVRDAARPDPRMKDPMDGSEINNILFQALRGVTQWGEQGEATKKALLLAIEAAAEIGRPDGKEIAKWMGQLEATAAALSLLKLPGCPETNRYQREMQRNLETVTRWMDENKAMMNYKGQKTESQNPTKGTAPGFRPCRMAAKGCKEHHQLDRCGVFSKMSSEQKLAALQERQLCVFCYKHQRF